MLKKVVFSGMVVLMLLVPLGVSAQSATGQSWSTSITYYTPSDVGGTLQISYYAEGSGTPIEATPITLDPHKAGSLYIGNVSGMTATFSGAAVLSADIPIVATAVNLAGDSGYARPLYTGFTSSQASENFVIPTVVRKWGTTSLVSIQNVETTSVDVTIKVFAVGEATPAFEDTTTIPGQSAKLYTADVDMGLSDFTGSATIAATGGKVVAAVQETDDSGRSAKAFEGVPADAGAATIYMASMSCDFNGNTSRYAIQNVGTGTATVEIDFYDRDTGALLDTATGISIAQNNKQSVNPCNYVAAGTIGSAVIRSTNSVPLVAMGKVAGTSTTATAFVGQTAGAYSVAAPYIRWGSDPYGGDRSNIAVMNVGAADATDIVVTYYDADGSLTTVTLASATDPLGQYLKANTNASTAGALVSGEFGYHPTGGAVEIASDQPIVVVVRGARQVTYAGYTKLIEDYNGVSLD